jgi:hypothetical protein
MFFKPSEEDNSKVIHDPSRIKLPIPSEINEISNKLKNLFFSETSYDDNNIVIPFGHSQLHQESPKTSSMSSFNAEGKLA